MSQNDDASRLTPHATPDCGGCALADRRGFLRDAGLLALGALAALGMSPAQASALPVRVMTALARNGTERRYPIPAGDGVSIDHDEGVMVTRWGNKLWAFALTCPHQNTALRWIESDHRFECPKHHSKYQPDGTFISGRATRNLDRFAVRREGAQLVVDLDDLYRSDKETAQWQAASIAI